ncbi:hypothetical protein [Streptomyces chartreusis]
MSASPDDLVHGSDADRWGGWSWRDPSRGEHYRTCSYCGSIHPEDLAAESEWHAEWADPKYGWPHKFYIAVPNQQPEQLFITGATTGTPTGLAGAVWIRATVIPDDVNTEGWQDVAERYQWVSIGTRPAHHAKFYTAHLADPASNPAALEAVQRTSGLRFRFHDGRVHWEAFT